MPRSQMCVGRRRWGVWDPTNNTVTTAGLAVLWICQDCLLIRALLTMMGTQKRPTEVNGKTSIDSNVIWGRLKDWILRVGLGFTPVQWGQQKQTQHSNPI